MIRCLEELKKSNKRTKRRPISQIRISDNMDNHIETPSKVIRVDGNGECLISYCDGHNEFRNSITMTHKMKLNLSECFFSKQNAFLTFFNCCAKEIKSDSWNKYLNQTISVAMSLMTQNRLKVPIRLAYPTVV